MRPFYFGAAVRPLFGIYGPPVNGVAPRSGVALCYPFGQEYLRSHRALRELSRQLSQRGHHTLRFDYFGCGDSSGSAEDCTVDQWLQDIEAAVTELRESAGSDRVVLLGLRLGGALAALAASRGLRLDRLVLWDPIVSGRAYLDELGSLAPGVHGRQAAPSSTGRSAIRRTRCWAPRSRPAFAPESPTSTSSS